MSDTATPSDEQRQRAKWDRLLDDIEDRQEQLRQIKPGTQRMWLVARGQATPARGSLSR